MELFTFSGWACLPILIGIITALLVFIVWRDQCTTDGCELKGNEADQLLLVKKFLGFSPRRFPRGASKLLDFLYLSAETEATNRKLLTDLGITHVINCAAGDCATGEEFYGAAVKYMEFTAMDDRSYDLMQHFDEVHGFIEDARRDGGKALIHCVMGVNRSAALAVAYVMVYKNIGLLEAVVLVRNARRGILRNEGFQRQLVQFANQRGL